MLTILFILTTAAATWTATHYRRKAIDARGERDVARDDAKSVRYANDLLEYANAEWQSRCQDAQEATRSWLDLSTALVDTLAENEPLTLPAAPRPTADQTIPAPPWTGPFDPGNEGGVLVADADATVTAIKPVKRAARKVGAK